MLTPKIALLLLSLGLSMEATVHKTPVGFFTCKEESSNPTQLLEAQLIRGYLCHQKASSARPKELIRLIASYLQVRALYHKTFLKACKNAFLIRCVIQGDSLTEANLYLSGDYTFGNLIRLLCDGYYYPKEYRDRKIGSPILLLYWLPNGGLVGNPFKKEVSDYFEQCSECLYRLQESVFDSHHEEGAIQCADQLYQRKLSDVFTDQKVTIYNEFRTDFVKNYQIKIAANHLKACKMPPKYIFDPKLLCSSLRPPWPQTIFSTPIFFFLLSENIASYWDELSRLNKKIKGKEGCHKGSKEEPNYEERLEQDHQSVSEAFSQTLEESHTIKKMIPLPTSLFAFFAIVSLK